MLTRAEIRARAIALLRAAGSETAALDADVLLAHATGAGKEELYAHPELPVADADAERFLALAERRAAGEPVAYLRGFKEFYGLRFAVDRRVLIPRPETETLVDAARVFVRERGAALVADVGTGCGAIAVALAVNEARARVIATDLSADALAVALENVRWHGVADRVELRRGDLLAPLTERVDAVVANLPYLREDALQHLAGERTSLAFEPRVAVVAGPEPLALLRRCVAQLPRVLAPGGAAFFECDPPQARALAAEHGGSLIRDLAGA
ncbi:MAG: peptide chain release factor N(5)-glutamine methyltransferase, partial [Candidatus Limnocylindria bacterium]